MRSLFFALLFANLAFLAWGHWAGQPRDAALAAPAAAAVPTLELVFRFVVAERIGTIILSALVAHTGWHWMLDRYSTLSRFRFEWPVLDAAFFVIVLRWLMLLVALAGVAWLIFGVLGRRSESTGSEEVPT